MVTMSLYLVLHTIIMDLRDNEVNMYMMNYVRLQALTKTRISAIITTCGATGAATIAMAMTLFDVFLTFFIKKTSNAKYECAKIQQKIFLENALAMFFY